jgi:hypothetical protein
MALTKSEMIKYIKKEYEDSGYDDSSDNSLREMDPEEIREIFMDVVGYDPDEMAKGGEVKNRMKKPVKKANGGRDRTKEKANGRMVSRGTGAAIRGKRF